MRENFEIKIRAYVRDKTNRGLENSAVKFQNVFFVGLTVGKRL